MGALRFILFTTSGSFTEESRDIFHVVVYAFNKYIRPASGRTRDDGDDLLSTSGSQRYIDVPTRRKYKTEIKYLQDDTRTK